MDDIQQTLKFRINSPMFRMEIKDAFEELADHEKQQKTWPKNSEKHPHSYWDSLIFYVFETIFFDCDLDEYKEEDIGRYFYNQGEALKVYEFCKWFDKLTEEIGGDKPDSAYLNHPEWHKVYSGAKKLFDLMDANDKKYNFNQEYEEYYKLQFPNYGKGQ